MALVRTISHHTGGGGRASAVDLRAYHFVTEVDGTVVPGKEEPEDNIVTADGDYARHTLNLNSGSIGIAMAGMHGATESPLDFGDFPLTERQFEAHCALLAELHIKYAIPVTPETCLTHAEVEPRLGVKQRGKWDIVALQFRPDLRGALAVGDYMRERVRFYMAQIRREPFVPQTDRPTLRRGSPFREDVRRWQDALQSLGFHAGEIDGRFGPYTHEATMAFQAANGLKTDGIVGPRTWAALEGTPQPKQRREVTADDLRERGSRTIQTADAAKAEIGKAVRDGGGVLTLSGIATQVSEVAALEGPLGRVLAMLNDHWWVVGVAVAGYVGWRVLRARGMLDEVIGFRAEDAQTGANVRR